MNAQTETIDCPLCKSDSYDTLESPETSVGIRHCLNCGFVYTSPRLNAEGRSRLYEEGYFTGLSATSMDIDYTANSVVFEQDAIERLTLLSHYLPPRPCKVLEIGSAAGFFLAECARRGHHPVGVELSDAMRDLAKKSLGITELFKSLDEVADNDFDAAALWHTLEHLDNPVETLEKLKSKLADGGLLFITVPDFASGNHRRLGNKWGHLQPLVHLSHFTDETLVKTLSAAGFVTLAVMKSGGTGALGKKSALPGLLKSIATHHIKKVGWARSLVRFILLRMLGRNDFVTIVGRRK